MGIIFNLFLYA